MVDGRVVEVNGVDVESMVVGDGHGKTATTNLPTSLSSSFSTGKANFTWDLKVILALLRNSTSSMACGLF